MNRSATLTFRLLPVHALCGGTTSTPAAASTTAPPEPAPASPPEPADPPEPVDPAEPGDPPEPVATVEPVTGPLASRGEPPPPPAPDVATELVPPAGPIVGVVGANRSKLSPEHAATVGAKTSAAKAIHFSSTKSSFVPLATRPDELRRIDGVKDNRGQFAD